MYRDPTQPYYVTQGGPQGYEDVGILYREIERQKMLSQHILSHLHENYRLLNLLYSEQYGTYPPQWDHKTIHS